MSVNITCDGKKRGSLERALEAKERRKERREGREEGRVIMVGCITN